MAIDDKDRPGDAGGPTRLLLNCHDKIRDFSSLLLRLDVHVIHYGIDDEVRKAASDILNHFEVEVPLHHADEQSDLFPLLRSLGNAEVVRSLDALRLEHEQLGKLWRTVRPWLDSVQRRRPLPRPRSLSAFATRYPAYADREEREIYGAANRLSPSDAQLVADSMRQRRQLASAMFAASATSAPTGPSGSSSKRRTAAAQ